MAAVAPSPTPSAPAIADEMLASGAFGQLVGRLGGDPDAPLTRAAVSTLASLAESSPLAAQAIAEGGLADLLRLLALGAAHPAAVSAAQLVAHLASHLEGGRERLYAAGFIPPLADMLVEEQPGAVTAAEALWVLADGSSACRVAMLSPEVDALARLLPLLEPGADARGCLNAAGALCSLAEEDGGRAALMDSGALPLLVRLLGGDGHLEVTLVAAVALSQLADAPGACEALLEAGVVPLLVAHLQAGPEFDITVIACASLAKLAEVSADAREELMLNFTERYLVSLLHGASFHPCVMKAASTLWFLARSPQYRPVLAEAGALEGLAALVSQADDDGEVAAVAAQALRCIVQGSPPLQLRLAQAGGVESISTGLRLAARAEAGASAQLTLRLCLALAALLDGCPEASSSLLSSPGALPQLVRCMWLGADDEAALASAGCIGSLADSTLAPEALHRAAALPPLVALLGTGVDTPAAAVAARTLSMLAYSSADSREAIREAGAIQPLVRLLASGPSSGAAAKAAAALWYLARSPRNKEEIRRAGGITALVALLQGQQGGGEERPPGAKDVPPAGTFGRPGSPLGQYGRPGSPSFGR